MWLKIGCVALATFLLIETFSGIVFLGHQGLNVNKNKKTSKRYTNDKDEAKEVERWLEAAGLAQHKK